jgi:hypothetical protein
MRNRNGWRIAIAVITTALVLATTSRADAAATKTPLLRHVLLIILENKGFDETFVAGQNDPYLARDLTKQGELLTNYYGIGHFSLDNYIAMVSGIAPNPDTQADCFTYLDFAPPDAPLDHEGQVHGRGCVYPHKVTTLANQLEAKGLTWAGYMEDMSRPCDRPRLGRQDDHIHARAGDQYATRHNPFVYFHALTDTNSCSLHDLPLGSLEHDLKTVATTPNLVFITPNLCNDGHDGPSPICVGGGLQSADRFLREWVPRILASPAYQQDGMLIITFDEAEVDVKNRQVQPHGTDATSCCAEATGPNTQLPGLTGPGGGSVGAVILSRYVKPGSTNDTPYNHYSLLRSLEDLFGLDHLGYAGQSGLKAFGDDVYNAQQ